MSARRQLPPRLLSEPEVADLLGMSADALRKARSRGQGPRWTKLGHRVRYMPGDVMEYIRSCREQSAQEPAP